MRGFLFLLSLLAAAAAGGYFTKPSDGMHRGVATMLMQQGKVPRPDAATGRYEFSDFHVATLSRMSSGGADVLQCWGAFTRFLCIGPAAAAQAPGL
ncbi:MAG: hypothetical protein ABL956_18680 [Hyphomonadaceae bacterium]